MASPVSPASSRSPMPPSAARRSCASTLLTGLVVGFAVGAVALAVLFIYCGKKNRRPPAPRDSTPRAPQSYGKRIFSLDEVRRSTNRFGKLIGEGGFALVYEGVLDPEQRVAVKRLKEPGEETGFQTEVENLSRAHHKHVVSLVGYCIEEGHQILVYELVHNKTLKFHLHDHGEGRQTLDWPTRLKIALGSAKGLAYLHEDCNPRIIHRDIKATNILLDNDYEAKIADFGLARSISRSRSHLSTGVGGTTGYLDPEYMSDAILTEKADVYSFGVVLWELITGRGPVGLVEWVRINQVTVENGNFKSFVDSRLVNDYKHDEMAQMAKCAAACVRRRAQDRPKMSEIVRALEGYLELPLSLSDPNGGMKPGPSILPEMSINTPLASPGQGSSHHNEPTCGSRGAGPSRPPTQELEMGTMSTDSQGFSGGSRSSLF